MTSCTLSTEFDFSTIEKLFRTELARSHPRSTLELQDREGFATFTITAQDISALRAALNSVTSTLHTYEKTNDL